MYEKHTLMETSWQEVLELFLDIKRHYFAEISKKTGLSRPRTLRALRKLEETGVLKPKVEANVKYYSLSNSPATFMALGTVEYAMTESFLAKNRTLKRAMEMFSSGYKSYLIMLIFGSHAKGSATKSSDVDILLVKEDFSKEETKKVEELFSLINGRTGLKLSPYMIKMEELKKKDDFMNEIIENHLLLFGAEFFYRMVLG